MQTVAMEMKALVCLQKGTDAPTSDALMTAAMKVQASVADVLNQVLCYVLSRDLLIHVNPHAAVVVVTPMLNDVVVDAYCVIAGARPVLEAGVVVARHVDPPKVAQQTHAEIAHNIEGYVHGGRVLHHPRAR